MGHISQRRPHQTTSAWWADAEPKWLNINNTNISREQGVNCAGGSRRVSTPERAPFNLRDLGEVKRRCHTQVALGYWQNMEAKDLGGGRTRRSESFLTFMIILDFVVVTARTRHAKIRDQYRWYEKLTSTTLPGRGNES